MNISKIDLGDSEYNIKDKVARAVTDRMSADGDTLNVGYETTNFGDVASIGLFGATATVKDNHPNLSYTGERSARLYFNFVAGGVEYNSIGWEFDADYYMCLVYYYQDNIKLAANKFNEGYALWCLPNTITISNVNEFREIYNENKGCFTSYKEIKGVRVENTILTDDTIASLKGLSAMGSIEVSGSQTVFNGDYGVTDGVFAFLTYYNCAKFVEVHGGFGGSNIFPIFTKTEYSGGVPSGVVAALYENNSMNYVLTFTLPDHMISGDPMEGKVTLTFYR